MFEDSISEVNRKLQGRPAAYSTMIADKIKKEILGRIKRAEEEHNVRALYAVESGSRAWGFASQNSDYDVRFIYAHPKNWYLSVDLAQKRDVIEYPITDEIDLNGWDLRKALQLFAKSNPAFIEWLQSPVIYLEHGAFAAEARALLKKIYSIEKGIYHYRNMATRHYLGYLRDEIVPLKKYFYALRPLLAIKWIERHREPAPIEFSKLRTLIPAGSNLEIEISRLLARRQNSREQELAPAIPELNAFIETELARLKNMRVPATTARSHRESLNSLFRKNLA